MEHQLGYHNKLFILAFDQRSSFTKNMFGIQGQVTPAQVKMIAEYKKLIYAAFEQGLKKGINKEQAGLLVDEEFGDEILRDAKSKGYTVLLPTEKSGRQELEFEYGEVMPEHVAKYQPTFVKVLLRYNPADSKELNARQRKKLKQLADFAHQNGYKFLIEALVPPTADQLQSVGGDGRRYDLELRPRLEVEMIREIQSDGVEADVWKIEGLEKTADYQSLVSQARSNGREHVGVIVLGRHAPDEQVEKWLAAGAKVSGVIGFAIGRTIFWDPILGVKEGKISRDLAVETMANKYWHFYKFFKEAARAQN